MSKKTDSELNSLFAKLNLSNRVIILSYAEKLLREQSSRAEINNESGRFINKVKLFKRNE